MAAPEMRPSESNCICAYLPKRDELSLRTVLALPNASSSGLDSSTCCSTGRRPGSLPPPPADAAPLRLIRPAGRDPP